MYPTQKYYQGKHKPGQKKTHPNKQVMSDLGITAKKHQPKQGATICMHGNDQPLTCKHCYPMEK